MQKSAGPLPGNMIYAVCERFLKKVDEETGEKWTANSLAAWLTKQGYATTREKIFEIIRQGIDRDYIRLCPPRAYDVAEKLDIKFGFTMNKRIVDTRENFVNQNLADEAADLLVNLIRKVHEDKRKGDPSVEPPPDPNRVHIGFGAGGTTRMVAERLGKRLKQESSVPPLTIHALSSGFATLNPLSAPVAFFSYFYEIHPQVEFIGLFSAAVVKCTEYKKYKRLPGVREPFDEAKKLDITVTSLAWAQDEHGMLNMFLQEGGNKGALEKAGHVGDVQWQPYSANGPIDVDTGIRAVTIFELPDLVQFASSRNKHSVLVVGPCHSCKKTKEHALRPLFSEPSLRVCNHVVMDITTAERLLAI